MNNKVFGWIIVAIIVIGGAILLFNHRRAFVPASDGGAKTETQKGDDGTMKMEGEIVLGAVFPLSGEGSIYGLPIREATDLALDEININGGINGKKVVVQYEDGKCEVDAAYEAARKLIDVDNVPLFFGGVCADEETGIGQPAAASERPAISPSVLEPNSDENAYTFRLVPSDADAADVAARYAFDKLHGKKAAVIAEQTAYADRLGKVFSDSFTQLGGAVVLNTEWSASTTEFQTMVQSLKSAGADVIFLAPQTPSSGLAVLEAIREAGIKTQLLTTEGMIKSQLTAENPDLFEGLYGFEPFFDEDSGKVKAFLDAYETKYGKKAAFPQYMVNAYSSVYLAKGLLESNGMNGNALRDALAGLQKQNFGALSNITMGPDGNVEWGAYRVSRVHGGELEDAGIFER